LGISFARALRLSPLAYLYMARLMNLIFYGIAIWGSLWLLHKAGLQDLVLLGLLIAGMPMSMSLGASASSDATVLAVSFLTLSLGCACLKAPRRKIYQILFVLICGWLSLSKSIYAPLGLFPLAFFARRGDWTFCGLNLLACIVPGLVWSFFAKSVYVPARTDVIVNPSEQLAFFLQHPREVLSAWGNHYWHHLQWNYETLVGRLGWLDVVVRNTKEYFLYFLAVFFVAGRQKQAITSPTRLWTLCLCISVFFLLNLSLYMVWFPVGTLQSFDGPQGRHLLPILIFLILAKPKGFFISTKHHLRFWGFSSVMLLWIHFHAFKALFERYWN
jgi:uncharacterized membrane protein